MKENNKDEIIEVEEKKENWFKRLKKTKAGKVAVTIGEVVFGATFLAGGVFLALGLMENRKNDSDDSEETIESTCTVIDDSPIVEE